MTQGTGQAAAEPFAGWAVVELMGHRRLIGFASDVEIAGGKLLRVDVPENNGQPAYSQFYGAGAIYCLSPVSEEAARAMLTRANTKPWYAYEIPTALPKPEAVDAGDADVGGDLADDDEEYPL